MVCDVTLVSIQCVSQRRKVAVTNDVHVSTSIFYRKNRSTSVLGPLPARYLTDLGAEPYQEFLTLIINPRIAFFCGYS